MKISARADSRSTTSDKIGENRIRSGKLGKDRESSVKIGNSVWPHLSQLFAFAPTTCLTFDPWCCQRSCYTRGDVRLQAPRHIIKLSYRDERSLCRTILSYSFISSPKNLFVSSDNIVLRSLSPDNVVLNSLFAGKSSLKQFIS